MGRPENDQEEVEENLAMTIKLNKARIAELHTAMSGTVDRGDIPGIVTLLGRGDEIHLEVIGTKTIGGKEPMRRDSLS
jgi:hypothetical protein